MFMPQLLATFVYRNVPPSSSYWEAAKRSLTGLLARWVSWGH
jgi:hypothetical protein